MTSVPPLFLSTFINKIDKKGRVSVPASFRSALETSTLKGFVAFRSLTANCIEGFAIEYMEKFASNLDTFQLFAETETDVSASIFADAQPLLFDGDGRITLNEILTTHAQMTSQVAFVGRGRTFQLWEPKAFENYQQAARERLKKSNALRFPYTTKRLPKGDKKNRKQTDLKRNTRPGDVGGGYASSRNQTGLYVDATFGRGGYTRALLAHSDTQVIAFDRDIDAIAFGKQSFKSELSIGRLTLYHSCFSALQEYVAENSLEGIVFDFGLSSPQLADDRRGFSFQKAALLDMRMGFGARQAKDLLNHATEADIADILYRYGGEKRSRFLARQIVEKRTKRPFETTSDLLNLFPSKVPQPKRGKRYILQHALFKLYAFGPTTS